MIITSSTPGAHTMRIFTPDGTEITRKYIIEAFNTETCEAKCRCFEMRRRNWNKCAVQLSGKGYEEFRHILPGSETRFFPGAVVYNGDGQPITQKLLQ